MEFVGRCIFYEGDNPEAFRKQIQEEFGFDVAKCPPRLDCFPPGSENGWCFHCPGEHYEAIYESDRFPMGS